MGAALLAPQAGAGRHPTLLGQDLRVRGPQTASWGTAAQSPSGPLTWRRCGRWQLWVAQSGRNSLGLMGRHGRAAGRHTSGRCGTGRQVIYEGGGRGCC